MGVKFALRLNGEGFKDQEVQSVHNYGSSTNNIAEKPRQGKGMEKSVLDDIMGDPNDFGDIGELDAGSESDGGQWEDTLKTEKLGLQMPLKEETDEFVTKMMLLSLELLQGLLEGVSPSFTVNFHFIDSVRTYLSYALLKACVSPSSSNFQYASSIFTVLLLRSREGLKAEIGIFFPLIILRSLDSLDSPLHQRTCILRKNGEDNSLDALDYVVTNVLEKDIANNDANGSDEYDVGIDEDEDEDEDDNGGDDDDDGSH